MKKLLPLFISAFLLFTCQMQAQITYTNAIGIGGASATFGYSVSADGAGNIYAVGFFSGFLYPNTTGTYFINGHGGIDGYVAKYTSTGTFIWAFPLGGSGDDYAYSVRSDAAGNFYVVGSFEDTVDFSHGLGTHKLISNGEANANAYVAKYDSSGKCLWAFSIGGAEGGDEAEAVAIDPVTGNISITGQLLGTGVNFNPNGIDTLSGASSTFVAQYDANGNYKWAFVLNGGNAGNAIATDYAGNVLVSGNLGSDSVNFNPSGKAYLDSAGFPDFFVAKYNSSGAYQWAYAIGAPFSGQTGNAVAVDNAGGVYVTGYFNTDSLNFNPGNGKTILHNLSYPNTQQGYLTKYSSSGKFEWAFAFASDWSNVGQGVIADNAGHVFVTGTFGDTMNVNPMGATVHNLISHSPTDADIFIAEYDTAGNYIDAFSVGGTSGESGIGMCIVQPGSFAVTGYFESPVVDFNPIPPAQNVSLKGSVYDAFLAVYKYATIIGLNTVEAEKNMLVFPNPTTGVVNIYCGNVAVNNFEVTDMLGRTYNTTYSQTGYNTYKVNMTGYSAGLYFIKCATDKGILVQKVVMAR